MDPRRPPFFSSAIIIADGFFRSHEEMHLPKLYDISLSLMRNETPRTQLPTRGRWGGIGAPVGVSILEW